MRRVLKSILEILDGTLAVYGSSKRLRGQSVVEFALVAPLLVILIAGLAEIGWLAQNYLTLLEVTRVGARTGTVQQGETSPLFWENPVNNLIQGSILPTTEDGEAMYRNCNIGDSRVRIGFYNFIGCVMFRSSDPLFPRKGVDENDEPYPDDMIVSAFAVQAITPGEVPPSMRDKIDWPLDDTQPQNVVVGRYPSNANECSATGERDPFNYIDNVDPPDPDSMTVTVTTETGTENRTIYLELVDNTDPADPQLFGYDEASEDQVGFVWFGQHTNEETGCLGSDWTVRDVEQLINLQAFNLSSGQRVYVPSQGLILVEMHWRHETLSQFLGLSPLLSPVFAILGEDATISVWAVFPLPTVEPRIKFPS